MKRSLKLSIIIVNYNSFSYLQKCLQSLYNSNFPGNQYEIILIDNASSDNSPQLIKKEFPGIKLISNKSNQGFARANNQGIEKSLGEYILLLNPDTVVSHNTLSRMAEYMDQNPETGVSTCRVELPSGSLDDACHRGFPTPWRAFCHFSGLGSLFPKSKFLNGYHLGYDNLDKIHEIDSCVGAFMFIRKETGKKIGWLDEDYFWYGEDLDFCYRVRKSGMRVVFVPDVKIIHYKGISSGIKNHSKNQSLATRDIKRKATQARFNVMKLFYQKHYADVYPGWLRFIVMLGIGLKEKLTLLKYS